MENWLQYIFLGSLKSRGLFALLLACAIGYSGKASAVDSEFFQLGATTGVITIEDFTSEVTLGFNATFKASENFFLQTNYFQASVSLSSAEEPPQIPYSGDRTYRHLNLLLGYNVFQGELLGGSKTRFSSLYIVGGAGDTDFLDEKVFTFVYGIGYQLSLSRRYSVHIDYHNYLYDSKIVDARENQSLNAKVQLGLSWLF